MPLLLEPTFFVNKHTTAERITQTMDDCKFSCQNKYSTLKGIDDFLRQKQMHYLRDGWLQLQWWNK